MLGIGETNVRDNHLFLDIHLIRIIALRHKYVRFLSEVKGDKDRKGVEKVLKEFRDMEEITSYRRAVVSNLFGIRDRFHGRQVFR